MRSTSHLSGLNDICQVLSQFCRASMSSWNLVASASVLMGLYRWQSSANSLALDVTQGACRLCKRERAGDHGQCIRDARSHFTLCRVFTFEDYFLGATGEKVCNPRQSITSQSRVVEFQENTSVGDFIGGLWEVQKYGIYLLALIKVGCKVLYSENQLAFSRTFFFRNPCCKSERRCSRRVMMVEWRMCSRVLHKMEVSEMGR